jgi:hypothetical protein
MLADALCLLGGAGIGIGFCAVVAAGVFLYEDWHNW